MLLKFEVSLDHGAKKFNLLCLNDLTHSEVKDLGSLPDYQELTLLSVLLQPQRVVEPGELLRYDSNGHLKVKFSLPTDQPSAVMRILYCNCCGLDTNSL